MLSNGSKSLRLASSIIYPSSYSFLSVGGVPDMIGWDGKQVSLCGNRQYALLLYFRFHPGPLSLCRNPSRSLCVVQQFVRRQLSAGAAGDHSALHPSFSNFRSFRSFLSCRVLELPILLNVSTRSVRQSSDAPCIGPAIGTIVRLERQRRSLVRRQFESRAAVTSRRNEPP